MSLPEQVENNIVAHALLSPGEQLVVAVSGGVDSMVLLRLLHQLAPRHRWRLTVAHLNHGLRGRASDADERLVRAQARRLGWPFVSERALVQAHARSQGVSLEMAARELRHAFLARAARAARAGKIVLAHHADDQVETFFLRLLRGSSPGALAGMTALGPSPADRGCLLVRPLLSIGKMDLEKWANLEKIPFREDASNRSRDPVRNRLRHDLLPRLRRDFQPALTEKILRVMSLLAAEDAWLAEAVSAWARSRPRLALKRLPLALQRRCLEAQLLELQIPPTFDLIEHLRLHAGTAIVATGARRCVADLRGVVRLLSPAPEFDQSPPLELTMTDPRGAATFGGLEFQWRRTTTHRYQRPRPQANREVFDADRVGTVVTLRHWCPGDRFQPCGMARAVKLQDLFTNAKIPERRRHQLAVAVTVAGEIWWVEGLRMAEGYKVTPGTRCRLTWTWRAAKT